MKSCAQSRALVELLRVSAYELYRATLVGDPCEYVRMLGEELRNPRPGDLVLETSTFWMKNRDPLEGIGRLLRIELEPIVLKEQAEEYGYTDGEEIPKHRVFYVALEFDDGREYRWHNASFIKVSSEARRWR
jgi:hypothetical protein